MLPQNPVAEQQLAIPRQKGAVEVEQGDAARGIGMGKRHAPRVRAAGGTCKSALPVAVVFKRLGEPG